MQTTVLGFERLAGAPVSGNATAVTAPAADRSLLVDVVRGLAITLVVLGHTNQGVLARQWWGTSPSGMTLDTYIYMFHMPAFFFVTGIFLPVSIVRHGAAKVLKQRTVSILYPYFFWAPVCVLALNLLNSFTRQALFTFHRFLVLLVTGELSWFLPTLFLVMLVAIPLYRLPRWVFFAGGVAVSFLLPPTPSYVFNRAVELLPFLALGMWVSTRVEWIGRIPVWTRLLGAGVTAGLLGFATRFNWHASQSGSLVMGSVGTVMLLLLSSCLGNGRIARFLSWCGGASLAIFLLSEFPQGGVREVLARLGHIHNPWIQLLVPSVFAVLLPAWLYQHRYRLHIGWAFQPKLGSRSQ